MTSSTIRLLILSAAVAVGIGGLADARSRASGHHGAAPVFGSYSGGSRSSTAISFGAPRHGSSRYADGDVGSFGGRRAGRAYAATYAGVGYGSHAHSGYGHGGYARSSYAPSGYARSSYAHTGYAHSSYGHSGGGIQCVTFARADSGIELSGNASAWWGNAAGLYQRGARPEAGSVLNFRANGAMRMGHVAVVNQIVDSRTIDIDHANWGGPGAVRGGISRDISVVDVSPNNDWSAVRVALGHSGEYGSIYPTYGFIYNRPDRGTMVAANDVRAPVPALNPAPRDLRGPVREVAYDEVAEAPDSAESAYSSHRGRHGRTHRHQMATSYHTPAYHTAAYHAASFQSVAPHHHRAHGRF